MNRETKIAKNVSSIHICIFNKKKQSSSTSASPALSTKKLFVDSRLHRVLTLPLQCRACSTHLLISSSDLDLRGGKSRTDCLTSLSKVNALDGKKRTTNSIHSLSHHLVTAKHFFIYLQKLPSRFSGNSEANASEFL